MKDPTKYRVGRGFKAKPKATCEFTVNEFGMQCGKPATKLSPRTNNYLCDGHFSSLLKVGMFDIDPTTGRFESS